MPKSRKMLYLAVTAVAVILAAAVLLPGCIERSRDRAETMADIFSRDSLSVGNERLRMTSAKIKAGWRRYFYSEENTGNIRITDMSQTVIVPDGHVSETNITVYSGEEIVFSGTAEQFPDFFPENGQYQLEAVCSIDGIAVTPQGKELKVSGEERFAARLEYAVPMKISFAADHIKQGSVIPVTGSGVRGEVSISAGDLAAPFPLVTDERGYARGLFSISYSTAPGSYTGIISSEEGTSEFCFTVEEEQYPEQHLIIPVETVSSTVGNSDNRNEYNSMMRKTYESWYPERFYDDCFTQPVGGTVTTEFGLFRYTNDDPVPTRHVGIDIANAEGTPVLAAASGYVIVADYNGVSGYTVVIDHGLGVRTYYFHMSKLSVAQGDFAEEGSEIGQVGSTGYATGPHLHFNVMVHDNSIDPWATFTGTSGIFDLE